MLHVRELSAKYVQKEEIFDVAGNWVQTDPRSWRKRRASKVKTGIGYSAKTEKMAVLTEFLGLQKEIAQTQGGFDGPLTSADGMYKLIDDIGKASGVLDATKYFRDPQTYQPPQPQPTLADAAFKLQQEKLSNDQIAGEADKVAKAHEFKEKMQWEKEKFEDEQDWEREKFEREMLYKYGESARQGVREFLNNGMPEKEPESAAHEKAETKTEEKTEDTEEGED
jgi:hypothetical protein